ncbi:MAG: SMI1/KNR4 family protein [Desulfobacteraceae bacterium]|jgi:hypothetical protein
MFDWLESEMVEIGTPKFHRVDGPATEELRQAIEKYPMPVPPSYKEFVLRFGNADLYRQGSVYLVQVYAGPREAESKEGERLIHFGRTDRGLAYFKETLLRKGKESHVYMWHGTDGSLRLSADSFSDWLLAKCRAARRCFSKAQWNSICHGPEPFTKRELAVVQARKQINWRVTGASDNGDFQFEVHNGSTMCIPNLTIGMRWKSGEPFGSVWLPIGHISPGQTGIVEHACYKESHDPKATEPFEAPDPKPEDREQYWEFKV